MDGTVANRVWPAYTIETSVPAVMVLMPLGQIGAGIFLGWLWLQTRSIWMLALAHGALNNWGQYACKFMDAPPDVEFWLLTAVNLALLALGSFIWFRKLRVEPSLSDQHS